MKRPPLVFGAADGPPFAFPVEPAELAELGAAIVALVVSGPAFGPGAAFWLEFAASLVLDLELPLRLKGYSPARAAAASWRILRHIRRGRH